MTRVSKGLMLFALLIALVSVIFRPEHRLHAQTLKKSSCEGFYKASQKHLGAALTELSVGISSREYAASAANGIAYQNCLQRTQAGLDQ